MDVSRGGNHQRSGAEHFYRRRTAHVIPFIRRDGGGDRLNQIFNARSRRIRNGTCAGRLTDLLFEIDAADVAGCEGPKTYLRPCHPSREWRRHPARRLRLFPEKPSFPVSCKSVASKVQDSWGRWRISRPNRQIRTSNRGSPSFACGPREEPISVTLRLAPSRMRSCSKRC